MVAVSCAAAMGAWLIAFSVPASASGGNCSTGSSEGNTNTCMYVSGSGTYVGYMRSSAAILGSGRTLQSCLHAPSGARIGCTAYQYVPPGQFIGYTWDAEGYVAAGAYCAVTWRQNTDGSTTEIGAACVEVS
jgi:hypothetical protein